MEYSISFFGSIVPHGFSKRVTNIDSNPATPSFHLISTFHLIGIHLPPHFQRSATFLLRHPSPPPQSPHAQAYNSPVLLRILPKVRLSPNSLRPRPPLYPRPLHLTSTSILLPLLSLYKPCDILPSLLVPPNSLEGSDGNIAVRHVA